MEPISIISPVCGRWNWRRPDGQIKDMACRELFRKLETRGLIKLPPRQNYGVRRVSIIEPVEIDQTPLSCHLSDVSPVSIINIRTCSKYAKTFNYLIKEYHYLGYQRPVGQNMKYMIIGQDEQILGCLLFGAAAWKIIGRDQWIGWPADVRERNLGLRILVSVDGGRIRERCVKQGRLKERAKRHGYSTDW